MKHILIFISFAFYSIVSAAPTDSLSAKNVPFSQVVLPSNAFVFYVIGDWGRKGKYHQKKVAAAMNTCAARISPKFIISTGDNFYTFGVKSTTDKLWKESYEDIYKGSFIRQTDWYPVLGNHDGYGNSQAEIDYSKINTHWKMPADYYATHMQISDSSQATFIFTNSVTLVHENNASARQWKWIDSTLSASATTWKFVIGHYPVYSSNPTHGDSPALIAKLKPLLEKYHVEAYFCGHDHDLQHQQPKGSLVDYFVSGAGSELRPSASYEHTLFAQSTAGFIVVAITGHTMAVYFIDENANVIYHYTRGN